MRQKTSGYLKSLVANVNFSSSYGCCFIGQGRDDDVLIICTFELDILFYEI